jgi:hypothetical protein
VCLNNQSSILETLVLTTKPGEMPSFYSGANSPTQTDEDMSLPPIFPASYYKRLAEAAQKLERISG